MPVSDFRVVKEKYISGREYTIWKCGSEYINAVILGSADGECSLKKVLSLINIEDSQSGLTIVRDSFGRGVLCLSKLESRNQNFI